MHAIKGFTLLETLVAILLMSILLILAVPAYRSLLVNNQIESLQHRIITSIHYARAAAIGLHRSVYYCGSAKQKECDGEWSAGQSIISDAQVLQHFGPLPKSYQLIWRGSFGRRNALIFSANGLAQGQQGRFYLYQKMSGAKKQVLAIIVSATGRARTQFGE